MDKNTLTVDVYWSFRSPFSYILTYDLTRIEAQTNVRFDIKPVYPLIIRVPDFFEKQNPKFFGYLLNDVTRTAQMRGIPFEKPDPDPVVMTPDRMRAAAEQPYIYTLTRMATAAMETGESILPLIAKVSHLIWSGTTPRWHDGDHLEKAVLEAGFDFAALSREIDASAEALDQRIDTHQDALEAAGHWGVPTMVFAGEPFFGHDRVDLLLWRLQHHGLVTYNS